MSFLGRGVSVVSVLLSVRVDISHECMSLTMNKRENGRGPEYEERLGVVCRRAFAIHLLFLYLLVFIPFYDP